MEVCKPTTKAAFMGSTAMQVLVAWTRLELREGNLRVVCPVQSCIVSVCLCGACWVEGLRVDAL